MESLDIVPKKTIRRSSVLLAKVNNKSQEHVAAEENAGAKDVLNVDVVQLPDCALEDMNCTQGNAVLPKPPIKLRRSSILLAGVNKPHIEEIEVETTISPVEAVKPVTKVRRSSILLAGIKPPENQPVSNTNPNYSATPKIDAQSSPASTNSVGITDSADVGGEAASDSASPAKSTKLRRSSVLLAGIDKTTAPGPPPASQLMTSPSSSKNSSTVTGTVTVTGSPFSSPAPATSSLSPSTTKAKSSILSMFGFGKKEAVAVPRVLPPTKRTASNTSGGSDKPSLQVLPGGCDQEVEDGAVTVVDLDQLEAGAASESARGRSQSKLFRWSSGGLEDCSAEVLQLSASVSEASCLEPGSVGVDLVNDDEGVILLADLSQELQILETTGHESSEKLLLKASVNSSVEPTTVD